MIITPEILLKNTYKNNGNEGDERSRDVWRRRNLIIYQILGGKRIISMYGPYFEAQGKTQSKAGIKQRSLLYFTVY